MKTKQTTIMSEIMLPHGERKKLARDFKTSEVTVWKALTGRANTRTAKMLRKAAIERGGQVYDPNRNKKAE